MEKNRLEAFSDGVIAIIITIMVLELKVPHGEGLSELISVWPIFLCYLLSFIYVGNYWNNHHHLFSAVKKVNGKILWANLNLLFWLSLLPFATSWMGESHFAQIPTALYGFNLLLCAFSYIILVYSLAIEHKNETIFSDSLRNNKKGIASVSFYFLGLGLTFFNPTISVIIFFSASLFWFVPDRIFENKNHAVEISK